jgi:hypothetical protein
MLCSRFANMTVYKPSAYAIIWFVRRYGPPRISRSPVLLERDRPDAKAGSIRGLLQPASRTSLLDGTTLAQRACASPSPLARAALCQFAWAERCRRPFHRIGSSLNTNSPRTRVSDSTALDAANGRNHVASDALNAPYEEQFTNIPPSAPRDPLVNELVKAESDREKIEAPHIAAKTRIAALRKQRAAHEAPSRPVSRRCGGGPGRSAPRGKDPWPPACATRHNI